MRILSFIGAFALLTACGVEPITGEAEEEITPKEHVPIVPYFIAVHNEPAHAPNGERYIIANYEVLRNMVRSADGYGIKLTLMFTAQWADYIAASPGRQREVMRWRANGHEIAAHHHSIYHGNWDGYTDYPPAVARDQRIELGQRPEPYLGTLEDYVDHLSTIDPRIRSGCVNEEADKMAMPRTIIYNTCSGFANYGPVGTKLYDAEPSKGINQYVSTGIWRGVERKWLTHYQITRPENLPGAIQVMNRMTSGVYGTVLHSSTMEAEVLDDFLAYLAQRDPEGRASLTVGQIIDRGLLPEKTLPPELLD